jgi:hypothetical protein
VLLLVTFAPLTVSVPPARLIVRPVPIVTFGAASANAFS